MYCFLVAAFFTLLILFGAVSGPQVFDGTHIHHELLHEATEPLMSSRSTELPSKLKTDLANYPRVEALDERSTFSEDYYEALQLIRVPKKGAEGLIYLHERPVQLNKVDNQLESLGQQPQDALGNKQGRNPSLSPGDEKAKMQENPLNEKPESSPKKKKTRLFDLPRRVATRMPSHGWKRFYITLNLYENDDLIPFLAGAMVAFIEDELKPFFDIAKSVVVSIYSNNPESLSHSLIDEVLIPSLHQAGVRYIFSTIDGTCLGYTRRPKWMERIEWMSCIRNKALEPLYLWGMQLFSPTLYKNTRHCADDDFKGEGEGEINRKPNLNNHETFCINLYLRGTQKERVFLSRKFGDYKLPDAISDDPNGDKMAVLFFNDIYFRPYDITTLLESVEEPVIAFRTKLNGASSIIHDNYHKDEDDIVFNEKHHDELSENDGTTFDMACGMDFYYTFYDIWVSRDRLGEAFQPHMPYTDEPETQEALRRIISEANDAFYGSDVVSGRRLSIPVKCCWNGVAAIRGRLFIDPQRQMNKNNQDDNNFTQILNENVENQSDTAPTRFQMWNGQIYHYAPDAIHQLHSFHAQTILTRVALRRRAWADKMRSELGKRGETLETDLFSDVALLRSEYKTEALKKFNDGMQHLDKELHNSRFDYYRTTTPGLRFRHSLIPSYGGTSQGSYFVRDDTCSASECLLFCEDVIQAALLDGRAPVILMNPNVRVAYESEHFNRVTGWIYKSSFVFSLTCWLRWININLRSLFGFGGVEFGHVLHGGSTSAIDDWTKGDIHFSLNIVDDKTRKMRVNVTQATHMTCFFPVGNSTHVMIAPLSRLFSFFLCGILLYWMYKSGMEDLTEVLSPISRNRRASSHFRRCSDALYLARWFMLRAFMHPRGKLFIGCPRVFSSVMRYFMSWCGCEASMDRESSFVLRDAV